MTAGHHHRAPTAAVRPDGGVVVPGPLIGPLRAVLARVLARAADDGATPSPAFRELLWVLAAAERQPTTRPAFADETPPHPPGKLEISTSEAAELLGCSPQYVRSLCRSGALAGRRIGSTGPWLIDQARLDAWRHGTETP